MSLTYGVFLSKFCGDILGGCVCRHRWTGRYEAHLWDNSCKKEGQTRKGRQGLLAQTLFILKYLFYFVFEAVPTNFVSPIVWVHNADDH